MLKSVLSSIGRLDEETGARILAVLDRDMIEEIEAATRTEWLPAQYVLQTHDALLRVLGSDGFHEHWRHFGSDIHKLKMFKPLVSGALGLFSSPGGIFNMIPKGFGLVSRDFGVMHCERSDSDRADLIWTQLPELPRMRLFALACEASMHAPFDLLNIQGTVKIDESRYGGGSLVLTARW